MRRDVPLDHPDFGKAFPCRCVLDEAEEERLVRLRRYSNLGPLERINFEDFTSATPELAEVIRSAQDFAEDPSGWFVLSGYSGSGKTRLAAALANRSIQRGWPALFMIVPDLLDHLRSAYNPDTDLEYDTFFAQICNAPLLILDELGTQAPTPWAQEKLFQLINYRYNNRLPTVFSLAVPLEALEERLQTRLSDPALSRAFTLDKAALAPVDGLTNLSLPRLRDMTFAKFLSGAELKPRVTESLRRDGGLPDDRLQSAVEQAVRSVRFAFDNAKGYVQSPEGWLIFIGETGCGKTHLAAAIGQELKKRNALVEFWVVPELLDKLRSAYENNRAGSNFDEVFQKLCTSPHVIILDDLGVHSATAWAQEKLFQLLNYRYNAKLPLVITINRELANIPSSWSSRIYDGSLSITCEIDAPDLRPTWGKRREIGRSRR